MNMQELIDEYRKLAATGENFQGLSILNHKALIGRLCYEYKARTLLDYGCGRGDPWSRNFNLQQFIGVNNVTLYDPAFPKHDVLPPGRFDGVLCSDVLEHILIDDVPTVINALFAYAKKFVWASICCRAAKKTFPDGSNMHVTIQPMEWWRERFAEAAQLTENRGSYIAWHLTQTP